MKLKSLKYNQEVFNISHMCRELQVWVDMQKLP